MLLAFAGTARAQTPIEARTRDGREVILRPDGTWTYSTGGTGHQDRSVEPKPGSTAIGQASSLPATAAKPAPAAQPVSAAQPPRVAAHASVPVARPREATAHVATRRGNFRFWYDPSKWRPMPANVDGRFQLQLIGTEAYIAVIPEGTPIPIAQLKTLALENAKKSGTDVRIVSEDTRSINGRDVLSLQINVAINGAQIVFAGYYYGDPRGSIQVVGYVSERDYSRLGSELHSGLDGLDLNR